MNDLDDETMAFMDFVYKVSAIIVIGIVGIIVIAVCYFKWG